ncbi:MAG TPA: CaiB/BaiF CoA-transferase family protein [Candidatus Binataceae bacterium]|nr:CaiB/BaiF CoA-transferase family protein [Candidatus Binataceae bacterium]
MAGFLSHVKVLELGDEKGEFCGKLFAGAGADVIKVEPPGGGTTRSIGPFYRDEPNPERSLYFWHFNFGKRGVTLDINAPEARPMLTDLLAQTTVVIDSLPLDTMENLGLGWDALQKVNPGLVYVRITPFGRSGPWRDYKANDLVHMALGGEMMQCGYDPKPDLTYDTPPIAPQMWHSNHIAGNQAFIAALGALFARGKSNRGDYIDVPIHQAISCCTEHDVECFLFTGRPYLRLTGRHARPEPDAPTQYKTRDGRYQCVIVNPFAGGFETTVQLLQSKGFADDLADEKYKDPESRKNREFHHHFYGQIGKCIAASDVEGTWHEAQDLAIPWVPVRKPEENLNDEQWRTRETFGEVEHPELGRSFTYPRSPMLSDECPWRTGPRAPLIGEHNDAIFGTMLGRSQDELKRLRERGVI